MARIVLPDGSVVTPEVQIIGDDGKTYSLNHPSSWSTHTRDNYAEFSLPDLRGSSVFQSTIRADKPVRCKRSSGETTTMDVVKRHAADDQRLASCLRIIPSSRALMTFFSSDANLEIASNCRRDLRPWRAHPSEINTSALTCRATETSNHMKRVVTRRPRNGAPGSRGTLTARPGLLGKAFFLPKTRQSLSKIHLRFCLRVLSSPSF